jgi:hypothetical protein
MKKLLILPILLVVASCGATSEDLETSYKNNFVDICYDEVIYVAVKPPLGTRIRALAVKFNQDGSVATC